MLNKWSRGERGGAALRRQPAQTLEICRLRPSNLQAQTLKICSFLSKAMATQSGWVLDHCSWFTSASA